MNKHSLLLYITITLLNLFLFLPVFYTYGIAAPLHILIYWLSFDRIFSAKNFISNWSSKKIAGLGFASQWLSLILVSVFNGIENISLLDFLTNPLFIILLIITSLEYLVLYFTYSRFLTRQSKIKAGG